MDKKAQGGGGSSGSGKLQDYDIITKLGQGSFGVVYKVKRRNDQKIYVLKQIDISRMSTAQKKEAVHEATILSKINSPYIVKFYDSFTDRNQINIIMEFCENGDLGIYLKRQMGKQLTESRIWKFFLEMCLGMHYLHSNKILHRDIKTINMFLTKEDKIKIGDLGVAKMLNQTANFAHTVVGTPYYLSPELCEEKPYNHKSDVWSLGCVLYELCTLKHPFEANNQGALILKIVRGKYNPISSSYSKDLSNMVDYLLSKDYKKRPSIQEILNTPIMQDKAGYFGYGIAKPESLLVLPQGKQQQSNPATQQQQNTGAQQQQQSSGNSQQRQSAMPQEQIKKINDAAAALRQNNNVNKASSGGGPLAGNAGKELISAREKQYQQNLIDAAKQRVAEKQKQQEQLLQQQQQMQINGNKPAIQQKPIANNNNIPSSYIDPSKRQQAVAVNNNNLLNNNNFDQKEYERKHQQNLIQAQKQRPQSSNQQLLQRNNNQVLPTANKDIQANINKVLDNKSSEKQQIISAQNLNQQYVQQQQQLKGIPQNQRVKSGAPTQLSRQALMAQKQGQRLIKQGDNERPQIIKPDVKALRPQQSDQALISKQQQQNPLINANNQKQHSQSGKNYQHEINEVMNLPDDLSNKKNNNNNNNPKSNQELIAEAQRKRDALNRVNNKFQGAQQQPQELKGADLSGKAASELHDMRLMMPTGKVSEYGSVSSQHSRQASTTQQQTSVDDYASSDIGQKQLDDDEFAELLNGGGYSSSDFIQPTWNINATSGMRDTQIVPTFEDHKEDGFGDDDEVFKVHHDRDHSPYHKHNGRKDKKMNTIKEEDQDEEDRKSDTCSDKGYFSPENTFNDRDDDDYDSAEEEYQERMRRLALGGDNNYDDEDNQPYDIEDQQRKEKEEFGDSEEEDNSDDKEGDNNDEDQIAQMSMTMQDRKRKDLEKQLKECRRRQNELTFKIEQKVKEGAEITRSVQLFEKCYQIFCEKAQNSDELSDRDYLEINRYIEENVGSANCLQITATLFQLYFFKEELPSLANTIKELQSEYDRLVN